MTRKLQLAVKRCFDILVSLLVLVPFLPVWAVIALLIKLTSPGPVFFLQDRPGKDAVIFKVYKFRTMRPGSEKMVKGVEVMRDDDRVTSIGRFLRRSKLDEIPQCLNVLKGEMSLVGPRPIVEAEMEMYGENIREYLMVRPGITGMWQTSGRSDTTYEERVQMDTWYVRNWSVWIDMKYLVKTFGAVLKKTGAY